jgi:citrate lyase subunit beta / citryl-CoA lyase
VITETADARTYLFVPGDRPDRFGKAAASGADVVILDLEDAVSPDHKEAARDHVSRWLERRPAIVRINGIGTSWHDDDIAMAAGHPAMVSAVMVPKAEDPQLLGSLIRRLPARTGIIPLIETAAGVLQAASLCGLPGVIRPAFGSLDLAAQLVLITASVTPSATRAQRSSWPLLPPGAPRRSTESPPTSPTIQSCGPNWITR